MLPRVAGEVDGLDQHVGRRLAETGRPHRGEGEGEQRRRGELGRRERAVTHPAGDASEHPLRGGLLRAALFTDVRGQRKDLRSGVGASGSAPGGAGRRGAVRAAGELGSARAMRSLRAARPEHLDKVGAPLRRHADLVVVGLLRQHRQQLEQAR